jgi:putative membrane protein
VTGDALLAYAHFLTIFALASVLFAELVLLRPSLPADIYRRLRLIDRWYGIVAVLVIVTGLARLNFGVKGAGFYTHNPIFWTKMGLFAAVGLLSIAPTIAYLRWQARTAPDGSLALEAIEYLRVRTWILAELVLFLLIPLCAVLMARGVR